RSISQFFQLGAAWTSPIRSHDGFTVVVLVALTVVLLARRWRVVLMGIGADELYFFRELIAAFADSPRTVVVLYDDKVLRRHPQIANVESVADKEKRECRRCQRKPIFGVESHFVNDAVAAGELHAEVVPMAGKLGSAQLVCLSLLSAIDQSG